MTPDLVIFDCDGVLVDSEPISVAVLIEVLAGAGITLSPEEAYARFLGKSMASICEALTEESGIAIGDSHLAAMRREVFRRFRKDLRPVEGVGAMLRDLKAERCVASSSQPDRIRLSLEITGLAGLAGPDLFSAAMVERGKPAPDLFLLATAELGVEPGRCLVIEDSPPGIIAAQAAGMRVFAYQGASHGQMPGLKAAVAGLKPERRFARMQDLPALIAAFPTPRRRRVPRDVILAIDVGTGSARAGLFAPEGELLARDSRPIATRRPGGQMAEHDSAQVWRAVTGATRAALAQVAGARVRGLGFGATCSLVFSDARGRPVAVSPDSAARWNTISWHDHRAMAEARECTEIAGDLITSVGTSFSPEMQMPKLIWVKRRMPESWARTAMIHDLSEWLTWRATGTRGRALGPLASKWAYRAHRPDAPWDRDFLARAGLSDLDRRAGTGDRAFAVGQAAGRVSDRAAQDLGLQPGIAVASGLIDAHAGVIGTIGGAESTGSLALIAGTSNCVAALSPQPLHFPGIWGPYFGAAMPDLWLSEAGQSASGALLDHVIRNHASGGAPDEGLHRRIVGRIRELQAMEGDDLAPGLFVLPDFHGNRSPFGDPGATGAMLGLTLDSSFDALCRTYWRVALSIAFGVRSILEAMGRAGVPGTSLALAGGHSRNPLLSTLYREVTGLPVATLPENDAVLLGTAMNAASAAGLFPGLPEAARAMRQQAKTAVPAGRYRAIIRRDYPAWLRLTAAFGAVSPPGPDAAGNARIRS